MYSGIIDEANDTLLYRKFEECIDFCNQRLHSLKSVEQNESTVLAKEALCVIASQAYAELNRWQEVVPFITQLYDGIEDCPPKLLQLGILLHARMKDYATCTAMSNIWLRNPHNFANTGYPALVEVFVLNVLIPADRWSDIPQFLQACQGLKEEQRETFIKQVKSLETLKDQGAMDAIEESKADTDKINSKEATNVLPSALTESPFHTYIQQVCEWVKANMSSTSFYLIRNIALTAVIVYYFITRFTWDAISWERLAKIWASIVRLWKSMFSPYHLAKHTDL